MNKLSGWDSTIVALATPPGIGAIATIRLSGNDAFRIIDELFPSKKLSLEKPYTIHLGILKDKEPIDEVLVSIFRAPKSYTGEDVVEISCHGSPYIQQQVIQACINKGARLARAGEFTQRAFLNGKLDLAQAEAVADLIASDTAAAQKTALHNVRGGFSNQLKEMREQLLQFAALIELELDFATEDVEFADRAKFYAFVDNTERIAIDLADSFRLGNVIKNGISVAIIGKPNAGKSTLLNSLLNESRAIVSDIAGTTRDTIEEAININGIIFRIIDTAGIRSHSTDTIEQIGIERSMEKMRTADLVLYLFDINTETPEELQSHISQLESTGSAYLLVANKSDTGKKNFTDRNDVIFIAAKSNSGIEELKHAIYDKMVHTELSSESTVITSSRHFETLNQVISSLADIRAGLDNNIPGDLLALDIRRALFYLGEITGEVTNEEKLDYIFSKFCIGK